MRKSTPIQRLALVMGLGLAAVAGLLRWTGQRVSTVQASVHLAAAVPAIGYGAIAASWSSTTPVTTTVVGATGAVWPIQGHPVTVTFPAASFIGTAIFTFTPQTGDSSGPLARSFYFLDLRGVNTVNGDPVSVGEYEIALQYDPSELGGAQEHSLGMYNFDVFYGRWVLETTFVGTAENTVYCTTRQTGLFALGGYSDQAFLPAVLRNK